MDNICHTLSGAALAEAGLKQRTRYGSAALMLSANLPDVDVLAFLTDIPSVALRRGWSHGVLAQAVLPALLAGAFVLLDRRRPPGSSADASRQDLTSPVTPTGPPLRTLPLLALCYAGVLLHVGMDWLNTYGVRLLMPFSNQWFYGDSVFIVDPWLWLTLAAGVVVARRRGRPAPAVVALAVSTAYVAAMIASAAAARQTVLDAWTVARGRPPAGLMVGPVPVNPLRKTVIVDGGEYYERGAFEWWPMRVRFDQPRVEKNARHPAAIRAAETHPDFRAVLVWARFPYYTVAQTGEGTRVQLADMRFPAQRLFEVSTVVADR
jgi:inner membrane protein